MTRLTRHLHRLHRALGALLCALMLVWFASGAVMTISAFPYYSARERLRDLEPLSSTAPPLSPALAAWLERGGLGSGELRLVHIAGGSRWLPHGVDAPPASEPEARFQYAPLSAEAARGVAERVLGARARSVVDLRDPDQWTVPLGTSVFPLWRVAFEDERGTELYLSQANGEIVQRTERQERILAWLGAIPHWIYPTVLRTRSELWSDTVIALASLGLLLTASGVWIGSGVQRQLARRRSRRPLRDPILRWHQRIGLGFGVFVSAWLISGILSFTPFAWTQAREPWREVRARLGGSFTDSALSRVDAALSRCQELQTSVQLALRSLAGIPVAICSSASAGNLIVQLDRPDLRPRAFLDARLQQHLAQRLGWAGSPAVVERIEGPDAYYYPSHADPDLALPALRVQRADPARITAYLDARTGALVALHTERTRLERWLFHGLHSWDLPALYTRVALWRACLWSAMLLGAGLSALGLLMALRRALRRARKYR